VGGVTTEELFSMSYGTTSNAIYIGGQTGTGLITLIDMNGGNITFTNWANSGSSDAFIMKINNYGNSGTQWAARVAGSLADYTRSVCVDASENVYALVETTGSSTASVYAANSATASMSFNNSTAFINFILVKLNTNGAYLWATNITTAVANLTFASGNLTVSSAQDVYAAFYTASTSVVTMNSTNTTSTTATMTKLALLLTQYNSSGVLQWFCTITSSNNINSHMMRPSTYFDGIYLEFGYIGMITVNAVNTLAIGLSTTSSGTILLKFTSAGVASLICKTDIF